MCYDKRKEWMNMDDRLMDLYKLSDVNDDEDVHLLTLRENCAVLESQLMDIALQLDNKDRQILEGYIDMRNDLEFETVKAAMLWAKNKTEYDKVKAYYQEASFFVL